MSAAEHLTPAPRLQLVLSDDGLCETCGEYAIVALDDVPTCLPCAGICDCQIGEQPGYRPADEWGDRWELCPVCLGEEGA